MNDVVSLGIGDDNVIVLGLEAAVSGDAAMPCA